MQLSRLYCNRPDIFGPIEFNSRDRSHLLNVVFGAVRQPKNKKRDSHNLGKTTLIHVIDFMLLKDITGSSHFFDTHAHRFEMLTLFFEVSVGDGTMVTIRRSVAEATKIAMVRHEDVLQDFCKNPPEAWDHEDLSLSAAREILDGILNLRVIEPYDFRKAQTYFLRTQADYNSVLQLQKFQVGQHKFWKPFVMTMLGFDEKPVMRKYELDQSIETAEEDKKKREAELQVDEHDLLRMNAEIASLRTQLKETEDQLDRFEFSDQERRMMTELVGDIEARIRDINGELYDIEIDIRNVEKALSSKLDFKISEIDKIFEETGVHFPNQLKRNYEQLVEFNRALSRERNQSLRDRRKRLLDAQSSLRDEKEAEDAKRQQYRSILQDSDTLEKFKALQRSLSEQRAELTYLEGQYARLTEISEIEDKISELKRDRSVAQDEIKQQIIKSTTPMDRIAENFRTYCKRVLDHDGLFFLSQNTYGNAEFKIELKERRSSKASRQADGKSYKQMVCALFDLALLKAYEDAPFYHFVYHDGILEGLDDRKKTLFLELVGEIIAPSKIQYILSVIDADLPRHEDGSKEKFDAEEIILQLDDSGDKGRLFRMAEF